MPNYELIAFEQRTVNSKSGLNELDLTETETLPIVSDQKIMANARTVLDMSGFKLKEKSKCKNLPSETWEKKRTIVFSDHTKELAKDILSEELESLKLEAGVAKTKAGAHQSVSKSKQKEVERLTGLINQASIWKRIKFLFGGEL